MNLAESHLIWTNFVTFDGGDFQGIPDLLAGIAVFLNFRMRGKNVLGCAGQNY